MSMQQWWLYLVTVFAISATPGPNMLLVMHSGMRHGLRGALPTIAGCMTALVLLMGLSIFGLSMLPYTFPQLFAVLHGLAIAYLIWLGIQCWRHASPDQAATAPRPAQHIQQSFLVALNNPAAFLFFGVPFAQFIPYGAPRLTQVLILSLTFLVVEFGWLLAYASGGRLIATQLKTPLALGRFSQVACVALIGFGASMALVQQE